MQCSTQIFLCWVFLAERFDANLGGAKPTKIRERLREMVLVCVRCVMLTHENKRPIK